MVSGTPDYSRRTFSTASADEQLKISVTSSDSSDSFDKFPIPAKSWFMVDVPVTTPHFICASGETATVHCYGVF